MPSLSPDAQSALDLCERLLSAIALGGPAGRAQFHSTLHPSGHMAHARYARAQGLVFHDFVSELTDYVSDAWEVDASTGQKLRDMEEVVWGEPTVLTDGDVATVWCRYWFRVGGKLSHVGTNSFGLGKVYREGEGDGEAKVETGEWEWKIVVAHDTARRATEEETKQLDEEYAKAGQK